MKWTICFDTVCDGYTPIMESSDDEPEHPVSYDTEAEAIKEIESDPEFYGDCFACPMSDIGHKTMFGDIHIIAHTEDIP